MHEYTKAMKENVNSLCRDIRAVNQIEFSRRMTQSQPVKQANSESLQVLF